MQTYYSTLLVPIRPEIKEQISIGLLLRDEDRIYYKTSSSKLNWLKPQLPQEAFRLLRQSLNAINRLLSKNSDTNNEFEFTLFPEHLSDRRFWDQNYISYLSQYNHNLLIFSPPQPISLDVNENSFKELFRMFVSDEVEVERKKKDYSVIELYLNERFYPKVKERITKKFELTRKEIPSLIVPTTVDFIGQNENPVIGQSIDFSKRYDFVGYDVTEILSLRSAFEKVKTINGKYYIIGSEPAKANRKSHIIWRNIIDDNGIDFVDYREIEKISDYLKEHDVQPFVDSD